MQPDSARWAFLFTLLNINDRGGCMHHGVCVYFSADVILLTTSNLSFRGAMDYMFFTEIKEVGCSLPFTGSRLRNVSFVAS